MPRQSRLDAPGIVHHVMIRGMDRCNIFRNNNDRDDFLERLSVLIPETGIKCYAWALMSNHAHFLFRSGKVGISTLMKRLLTGYAVKFNKRHSRSGQLFQNRYKSVICQEDTYLKELVRYIHLNPLRAKIVDTANRLNWYKYSGHSAIVGRRNCDWQDIDYVLGFFNKKRGEAKKAYIRYVRDATAQGKRPELTGGGFIRSHGGWAEVRSNRPGSHLKSDERILGDGEFVANVLAQAEEEFEVRYRYKRLGYDEEYLTNKVVNIFDIKKGDVFSGSRRKPVSQARSLFCYWNVRLLGESMTETAKYLGLSQVAVGYAVDRGEKIARTCGFDLKTDFS